MRRKALNAEFAEAQRKDLRKQSTRLRLIAVELKFKTCRQDALRTSG
jgi:hypothetical protein